MSEKKVLIVEDELTVAEETAAMIQHLGHKTTGIAVSGEEAVLLAQKEQPDLVLMDIRLRGTLME